MVRYPFRINLGVTWMRQRPNFDSGVSNQSNSNGDKFDPFHSSLFGLVWVLGLNIDQWVRGNGQVSILDQFRCGMNALEANLWLWGQWTSLTHSTPVCLVWLEFWGPQSWPMGTRQWPGIHFRSILDDFVSFKKRALTISGFPIVSQPLYLLIVTKYDSQPKSPWLETIVAYFLL